MYSRLTLLTKLIDVYSENDREYADRMFGRIAEFLILNQAVHTAVRTVI
jgi:hypothetical protein